MTFENENKALRDALVSCKVPEIQKAVEAARSAGMDATSIINALGDAMSEVGVLFERGKLFLPHVLSAANGMKNAMDVLGPELSSGAETTAAKPSVVMGTVEGDVHDLGRDVPKASFVEEVRNGCTFCGMSALMTTTMTVQKDVIEMLKAEGLRDGVVVMVGGAPVTQAYADKIGADLYGESASETTRKASQIATDGAQA